MMGVAQSIETTVHRKERRAILSLLNLSSLRCREIDGRCAPCAKSSPRVRYPFGPVQVPLSGELASPKK
jgi:hypothetical protein